MNKKERNTVLTFDSMEQFSKAKHGKKIKFKEIPLAQCKGYFLSVKGDLLHYNERSNNYRVIQYKQHKKRVGRKKHKNGFAVDHYYQNGKRVFWKSRAKIMLITFKNWSLHKAMQYRMFPKNGNNNDVSLNNIVPYDDEGEARRNVHGIPQRRKKISQIETLKIQKSNKTNKELAKIYDVNPGTISRHRNGKLLNV